MDPNRSDFLYSSDDEDHYTEGETQNDVRHFMPNIVVENGLLQLRDLNVDIRQLDAIDVPVDLDYLEDLDDLEPVSEEQLQTYANMIQGASSIGDRNEAYRIASLVPESQRQQLLDMSYPQVLTQLNETSSQHRFKDDGKEKMEKLYVNSEDRCLSFLKTLTGIKPLSEWIEQYIEFLSSHKDLIDADASSMFTGASFTENVKNIMRLETVDFIRYVVFTELNETTDIQLKINWYIVDFLAKHVLFTKEDLQCIIRDLLPYYKKPAIRLVAGLITHQGAVLIDANGEKTYLLHTICKMLKSWDRELAEAIIDQCNLTQQHLIAVDAEGKIPVQYVDNPLSYPKLQPQWCPLINHNIREQQQVSVACVHTLMHASTTWSVIPTELTHRILEHAIVCY